MRISDCSSDVCSSDLRGDAAARRAGADRHPDVLPRLAQSQAADGRRILWLHTLTVPDRHLRDDVRGHGERWSARRDAAARIRFLCDADAGLAFRASRLRRTGGDRRSEEHTSELQSLMRISYAVFCFKKKKK